MSKIKQQSTIKDMILATIEEHIDAQNEKGMKKYGESIDDCPVDDYSWPNMVIEELIDALQYQQKEIGRLNGFLAELTPQEALNNAVEDYTAVSKRDEIIEDLEDEIEGLKKQLKSLGSEYWHWRSSANDAVSENKKLRDLLTHTWGED